MTFKRLLSIFFQFPKTVYFNFPYFKPEIAIKLPIVFILTHRSKFDKHSHINPLKQ